MFSFFLIDRFDSIPKIIQPPETYPNERQKQLCELYQPPNNAAGDLEKTFRKKLFFQLDPAVSTRHGFFENTVFFSVNRPKTVITSLYYYHVGYPRRTRRRGWRVTDSYRNYIFISYLKNTSVILRIRYIYIYIYRYLVTCRRFYFFFFVVVVNFKNTLYEYTT